MKALPNTICPLCGGANQCAPASTGSLDVACWCTKASISREALARIPADLVDKACLCPRCAGVVEVNLEMLIDRYGEAWSEPDAARREALLRSVWADNATYTDPTVERLDLAGLLAHIARVQASRPGARVRRCTAVDDHHHVLRFGFEVIGADGAVLRHGVDFVVLDASRTRLQQVTGFFGPLRSATPM